MSGLTRLAQRNKQSIESYEPVDNPEGGVDFMTNLNMARHDDDINIQRQYVADDKGVPLEDVRQTPQGLAYYKNDQWNLARPSDDSVQTFAANMFSTPGSLIGGGVGAGVGGIPGAAAGAALGDLAQTGYQEFVEGNDADWLDYLKSAGFEAGASLLGDAVVRTGVATVRGAKNKAKDAYQAGKQGVTDRLFPNAPPQAALNQSVEARNAMRLKDVGEQHGILLTPPEALGDKQLLDTQKLIHDVATPASRQMDQFARTRQPKIEQAVSRKVGPRSAYERNLNTIESLNQRRANLVKERADASSPFYERAAPEMADIRPFINELAKTVKDTEGTKIGSALKTVMRGVHRTEGNQKIPKELIGQLHYAKMDLDDLIESAKQKGNFSKAHELMKAKDGLVGVLSEYSDDYAQGMRVYNAKSGPINAFDEGIEGTLVKQGKNQDTPQIGKTLFGSMSSPEAVTHARKSVGNDELFTDMTMGWIKQNFDEVNTSATGEVTNIGGLLYKSVFGSAAKQARLKAALPEAEYQALDDLMTVLRATGTGMKGQSMTAPRQVMQENMKGPGLPTRPYKMAQDWYQKKTFEFNSDKIVNAITDPYNQLQLEKAAKVIRKYGGSNDPADRQRVADVLGALGGLFTARYAEDEL